MSWKKEFRRFRPKRAAVPASLADKDLLAFLEVKKLRLRRLSGSHHLPVQRAANARYVAGCIRRIVRSLKNRSRSPLKVEVLAFRHRRSLLADTLYPDRIEKWLPARKRSGAKRQTRLALTGFSFVDRPAEALAMIVSMLEAESRALDIKLDFLDSECRDVSPYLLMSVLWRELIPIFSGGSITPELQKVIEAVQLRRPLKMGAFRGLGAVTDVHAFPVHSRRGTDTSTSKTRHLDPQTREKVQDNFVQTINDWLRRKPILRQLTPGGRGFIKNMVGEVLDNAERHSSPVSKDGGWSVAGFMARRTDDAGILRYDCSITFLSIGATIGESLSTSPQPVMEVIDDYVRCHRRSAPEEVLRTVMALQDGITRVKESFAENKGGTGLQDVLEFVHDLGGTARVGCEPRVTIVSGRACIMLRRPYLTGVRAAGDATAPREVWFNAENTRLRPPDPAHAFALGHRLPGTLVALSFVLDPEYLNGVDHGDDQSRPSDQ